MADIEGNDKPKITAQQTQNGKGRVGSALNFIQSKPGFVAASLAVIAAIATALLVWLGLIRFSAVEDTVLSIFKDGAVLVLGGPLIFRPNLQLAGRAWEAQSNMSDDEKKVDFRNYRFLVYYSVHMTTFILAWILFIVRYFPEVLHLAFYLERIPCDCVVTTFRDALFGTLAIFVTGIGVALFWIHPLFVSPSLIKAYRDYNSPKLDSSVNDSLLGKLFPPTCILTRWRKGLFWISIAAAVFYPHVH